MPYPSLALQACVTHCQEITRPCAIQSSGHRPACLSYQYMRQTLPKPLVLFGCKDNGLMLIPTPATTPLTPSPRFLITRGAAMGARGVVRTG